MGIGVFVENLWRPAVSFVAVRQGDGDDRAPHRVTSPRRRSITEVWRAPDAGNCPDKRASSTFAAPLAGSDEAGSGS